MLGAQIHPFDCDLVSIPLVGGDANDPGRAFPYLDEVLQRVPGISGRNHHLQRSPELLVREAGAASRRAPIVARGLGDVGLRRWMLLLELRFGRRPGGLIADYCSIRDGSLDIIVKIISMSLMMKGLKVAVVVSMVKGDLFQRGRRGRGSRIDAVKEVAILHRLLFLLLFCLLGNHWRQRWRRPHDLAAGMTWGSFWRRLGRFCQIIEQRASGFQWRWRWRRGWWWRWGLRVVPLRRARSLRVAALLGPFVFAAVDIINIVIVVVVVVEILLALL